MENRFNAHLKAFLLSHQIGEDPNKNLAKIKVIANTNPARWDGKLPTRGIKPDTEYCKIAVATKKRPVLPWWWYAEAHEPVPSVVEDIYQRLAFDYAVVFPRDNAWIYVKVEPPADLLKLLKRQDHLKAFILISLVNKKFPPAQRAHKRLRLGAVITSKDIHRVFTFIAYQENDARYRSVSGSVPTITRLVHNASNTANWSIRLPGDDRVYGSLREIVEAH